MSSLNKSMNDHQVAWRQTHVASSEMGNWGGKSYAWLLPRDLWEEGLYPGIRKDSENSLDAYLEKNQIQKHSGAHNLKSSWILCANLYFPFRLHRFDRKLFSTFLRHHVSPRIESLERIELEYAEEEEGELNPKKLLGERSGTRGTGQTSPDLGLLVNGGRGLVLVENKFTEHHFSKCPAAPRKGNPHPAGNPDPDRCNHPSMVARNPCGQCHLSYRGRKYWEQLAPVANHDFLARLRGCPAAKQGYQLFRQTALAEGIARSGKYDLTISAVAVDDRNSGLNTCLRKSGISELCQWGGVFRGQASFALFTHQQWVEWVGQHDGEGRWSDWLSWIGARYAIGSADGQRGVCSSEP